ncbi:uncharacterized protein PFL1_04706 [Pseudozyma flocculosa PF-1]|uniref:Uncharacterized protein n=1 Tax=Pseudozyma flocculosa PF-1 TaxID=1277687 RepID=A0A061H4P2_9BASI|nr:uncharacterized protein PFL1_04706 [Pseudozyma flocculosa PF-1]EPQ27568.1 hypothetical protein PFL1_04706 [Pseudozyma flocculosa PF-1]
MKPFSVLLPVVLLAAVAGAAPAKNGFPPLPKGQTLWGYQSFQQYGTLRLATEDQNGEGILTFLASDSSYTWDIQTRSGKFGFASVLNDPPFKSGASVFCGQQTRALETVCERLVGPPQSGSTSGAFTDIFLVVNTPKVVATLPMGPFGKRQA